MGACDTGGGWLWLLVTPALVPQLASEACSPQTTLNQLLVAQWGRASIFSERWLSALLPPPYLLPFCLLFWCSNPSAHFPSWSEISFTSLKGRKRFDTLRGHGELGLKQREGKVYREEEPSCTFLDGGGYNLPCTTTKLCLLTLL